MSLVSYINGENLGLKAKRLDVEKELASRYMEYFVKWTFPEYEFNWHNLFLCKKLDDFVAGKIKRLMVFMPPRHGKSELVSRRLPAYAFGRNPNEKVISCSYGADLASRMNRDVQRIMDDDKYRQVFPHAQLFGKNIRSAADGAYLRNSDLFEIVDHKGVYRSCGVGGAITGMGSSILILDDPIKNMEEALSKVYRDRVWEWYTSTFYTRLERGGRILITVTRWNEDDICGRLLELAKKDPSADQWEVINFPAIKEHEDNKDDPRKVGEALWPSHYPVQTLNTMKSSMGSRVWAALYQQRPAPDSGNMVKREWWKFYRTPPDKFDWVAISWDFTFKGNETADFVVGQVWGKIGVRKYLLDMVRARMSFTESVQAMLSLNGKWHPNENLIEEKANGAAVIDVLKTKIHSLIAYNPKESKESRAMAVSPQIESGSVFLPDPSENPWVHDFIEEWAVFPNGKNDDVVDCCSQIIIRFDNQFKFMDAIMEVEEPQESILDLFWDGAHRSND